jgi:DNA mismatch endonuclease (patch repair protein)
MTLPTRSSGRPASSRRLARPTEAGSWASTEAVRRRMQRQRTRDTSPELALRRLLHASGLRYRVDVRPLTTLSRRADLVFSGAKIAVFVDGCYWHGCADHGSRVPHSNAAYWAAKIERNRARDADTDRILAESGWLSLRFWEHADAMEAADQVRGAVSARTTAHRRVLASAATPTASATTKPAPQHSAKHSP